MAVDASGNVLVADTNNHRVRRVTPSGGTAANSAAVRIGLCLLTCFVFLSAVVSTLAGGFTGATGGWIDGVGTAAAFNGPNGVALDASGNVLVADQGNHRVRRVTPSGGTWPG